jgi:multiple PDZ domain protein
VPKLLEGDARNAVMEAAQGREVKYIKLYKPEGSSLGFSVVGLKSAHKGELGIYVQEIQPQGIAGKDGRLQEGDQVTCLKITPSFTV